MNLNPTPLEILILLVVSLSIYAWMRHGAAIRRWWTELWKKRRGGDSGCTSAGGRWPMPARWEKPFELILIHLAPHKSYN